MPPLTVTVCTLDEERRMGRMIDSVRWADEILVLDSGSKDETRYVAESAGARVESEPWRGFAAQKNEAARRARHDWILSLDADEVVDDELAAAIRSVMAGEPDPRTGFVLDRRGDFLGVLLPNNTRRAKRRSFVRLYHRDHSSWDESMPVHEVVRVPGDLVALPGILLHLNDLTMSEFVDLFSRYAAVEADVLWSRGVRARHRDLVARPAVRFVWHYLVCGEWRLGRFGAAHAGVKALRDFLRYARLLEMENAPNPGVDDADPRRARRQRGVRESLT